MEDRRKTVAAVAIIVVILVFFVIGATILITGKKIVSPVPDEGAIKIIFVTPTPVISSPSITPTPSKTAQ